MPTFDCYFVKDTGKSLFSIEIGSEGIFLFISPIQFAMLWPGVKL